MLPVALLVCMLGALAARAEIPQYGTPFTNVPEPKDAIIYQVNFRAFSAKGDFASVQARLDDIKALGTNVLYLMPIYPVGVLKTANSPYCVSDYTGVNREFGTLEDVRTLVEEAHKRGMSVLFDWVANHTAWDNPWIKNKSWYKQDAQGNIIVPPKTDWNDVAALNYDNKEMRLAMIEAMKYWIYQANIDGYRCDTADFVPADFWEEAIASLRAIPNHKLLMFAEGTRGQNFAAGFQMNFGFGFFGNMKKIFAQNATVRSINALNKVEYVGAKPGDQVVRYVSNHDVDLSDGSPLELFGGKEGSLAAFVVAACMKGVPMIYNGQEVGCPLKLTYFDKSTTIDWSLNPETTQEYKKIIAFRKGSEAIKQGYLQTFSSADVCTFTKSFDLEQVLVLVNMRNKVVSYQVPTALKDGSWRDVFEGRDLSLADEVSLQPFQYKFVKRQLSEPAKETLEVPKAGVKSSLRVPADFQGWDPQSAPLLSSVEDAEGLYEGYVNFPGSGPHYFQYTNASDWNSVVYGDGGNGTLTPNGKGAFSVPDGGYYELTADLNKNRWTATKTTWSVVGGATPGGWNRDTPLAYDPLKQVWTGKAALTASGSFKFRANKAWAIDFGVDESGDLQYVDNPFLVYNPALRDLTAPADGTYTITLDLHVPGKYTYELTVAK